MLGRLRSLLLPVDAFFPALEGWLPLGNMLAARPGSVLHTACAARALCTRNGSRQLSRMPDWDEIRPFFEENALPSNRARVRRGKKEAGKPKK
eukprot:gene53692-9041_t